MSVTIQKSTLGNSFTVLSLGQTKPNRYQCGDFYFQPNGDGTFSLINKFNGFQAVSRQLPSSVINGDTSSAFADLAAVDLYCATNFFYKAGTGAGILLTTTGTSGAASLTGTVLNIPQYSGATYTQDASATPLTKAQLNAGAYAAYLHGSIVFVATANVKYLKIDDSNPGNWDTQPYNLTT